MIRDSQRARRQRTVFAPNGARVILPVGTPFTEVIGTQLRWTYEQPMLEALQVESEIGALIRPLAIPRALQGVHWTVG